MSVIINIATAVPPYQHQQSDILNFMLKKYQLDEMFSEKIKHFYTKSSINIRHSAIPDFTESRNEALLFDEKENKKQVVGIEKRLEIYEKAALPLAQEAIEKCLENKLSKDEITHLITVSCTGMSAPGLDLDLMQNLDLKPNTYRTSVNFMGCYAAFHALKHANAICRSEADAKVMIVCVELCTLHFQNETDMDNITATMLFADGAAAVLVTSDSYAAETETKGLQIGKFYSEVAFQGRKDMAWNISKTGFLMRLSSYIPKIIQGGVTELLGKALVHNNKKKEEITHWAIHPGGRKILDVTAEALQFPKEKLSPSYKVLNDYGNMSSPTILFVLKEMWQNNIDFEQKENIFASGFGPGLTMETMILETFN